MHNFVDLSQLISNLGRSVAAKFEYTAYSKLAAVKISNMGIIEFTYVYSNIHGHFVAKYRILGHKVTTT